MRKTDNLMPTLQSSFIQGFFWANFCAIFVYAAKYMLDSGLTNSIIGVVIACGSALSAVMQPIVGAWADRSRRMIIRRLINGTAGFMILLCCVLLLPETGSAITVAVTYALLIAALQIITPLTYSLSMFFSERGVRINFGVSRAAGSLTYAGASALLGILVEKYSTAAVPCSIIVLCVLLILSVSTFRFKGIDECNSTDAARSSRRSIFEFFKNHRRFTIVLFGNILLFISYNIISNYSYQIFSYHGYGSSEMGIAISFAAVMELPTLFLLSKINRKFASGALLKFSAVFIFIKIFLLFLAKDLTMILVAMGTQIFGYALFAGISVYYVTHSVEQENLSLGQSLMTMTITVGAVLGSLLGGRLLDAASVPVLLGAASGFALLGAVIICLAAEKGKTEAA